MSGWDVARLLLARNRELRHELERVREERDHWEMAHDWVRAQRDSARRFAATAVEGEAWLIERISGVATAAEELPRSAVIAAFRAVLAEHAQRADAFPWDRREVPDADA